VGVWNPGGCGEGEGVERGANGDKGVETRTRGRAWRQGGGRQLEPNDGRRGEGLRRDDSQEVESTARRLRAWPGLRSAQTTSGAELTWLYPIFIVFFMYLGVVATTSCDILKANACTGICFQPGHSKI